MGVEAGSIVISKGMVNAESLKSEWILYSCGHRIIQSCNFDVKLSMALHDEGQARLDGSTCLYDKRAQKQWLEF